MLRAGERSPAFCVLFVFGEGVMSEPYRDRHLSCPACQATLRAFKTRQVCDACDGMMVTVEDLASAIHELTSLTPALDYRDEKPGTRRCPHCTAVMTTCKIAISIDDETEKPKPTLDRCVTHGIWFDREELAKVFEKVASKGFGGGLGRGHGVKGAADGGQEGWSAMFKGRSGGWGGW
jgi:Zn-finger nucleic acid-binding protein